MSEDTSQIAFLRSLETNEPGPNGADQPEDGATTPHDNPHRFVFDNPDDMMDALNKFLSIVPIGKEVQFAFIGPNGDITLRRKKDAEIALNQYRIHYIQKKKRKGESGYDEVEKYVPAFQLWLSHPDRKEYDGLEFCPDLKRANPRKLNLWRGFAISAKQGKYPLFEEHLRKNVCQNDLVLFHHLMSITAQMFQEPGKKLGIALVLMGDIGVGKSTFSEQVGRVIGIKHAPVFDKTGHLTGQFRGQLEHALVIRLEEGNRPVSHEDVSTLKHVITSHEILIERKGVDAYSAPNYARLIITTNSEHPIPAVAGERRFFVLNVGKGRQKDRAFFAALNEEMENGGAAAWLYDLLHYDYSDVDFAKLPMTASLQNQIRLSFPPEVRWLESILCEGALPFKDGILRANVEWDGDSSLEIDKASVVESFRDFVPGKVPATSQQVGIFLKKHVPDLVEVRRNNGRGRERFWKFPTISEMRERFMTSFPGYRFPEDPEASTEAGPGDQYDPDVVPLRRARF